MSEAADSTVTTQRIDKWLWCARQFKTRSLAARFVSEESVRVSRSGATQRIDRPAFSLRLGDEISWLQGEKLVVVTVTGFAKRRGAPQAARLLFADTLRPPNSEDAPDGAACKDHG